MVDARIGNRTAQNRILIDGMQHYAEMLLVQLKQKMGVLRDFLKWMLGPGQGMTADLLFAPLPQAVVAKEQAAIAKIH